ALHTAHYANVTPPAGAQARRSRPILINAQIAAALRLSKKSTRLCRRSSVPFKVEATPAQTPAVKPLFGSKQTLSDRFCTPALISQRAGGMAHVSQIELGWHRLCGGMFADAYTPDGRFSRC